MFTQREVNTMTKGSLGCFPTIVSFVGPAPASSETGKRVELRSVSGGPRSGESTD
jgi:hypothetical protein